MALECLTVFSEPPHKPYRQAEKNTCLRLTTRIESFDRIRIVTLPRKRSIFLCEHSGLATLPSAQLSSVLLLLRHTKIESTVCDLGVAVNDALGLAERKPNIKTQTHLPHFGWKLLIEPAVIRPH